MVRPNGLQRLALRTLSSHLLHNSSASLNELVGGRHRSFGTTRCWINQNRFFNRSNSKNVNHGGEQLRQVRPIHGTAAPKSGRDYFDVLGESKNATSSEVKKAYYMLAKNVHPDTNKGDPDATKKFHKLQEAYEVLKDDGKRAGYIALGRNYRMKDQNGGAGYGPFGHGGGSSREDLSPLDTLNSILELMHLFVLLIYLVIWCVVAIIVCYEIVRDFIRSLLD